MFLLQANFYLLLFYGFFWLLLRRETFHQLNRWFLLGSVVMSFIIPAVQSEWLLDLLWSQKVREAVQSVSLQQINVVPLQHDTGSGFTWLMVLRWLYGAGVLASAGIFICKLIRVRRLIQKLNFREKHLAFSFFRFCFVSEMLPDREVVATHEQVHVSQFHSADVLFMEIVQVFNWFNPVVYALKQSLKNLHEFIADAHAVRQTTPSTYAMLLFSQAFQVTPGSLTHHFFDALTLKTRIFMLQKPQSRQAAILKYGLLLPLFAAMLITSSAFVKNPEVLNKMTRDTRDSVRISGTVFDGKTGKPLTGAIVVIKNTNRGVATDAYGYFSLTAPANSELAFSYVGFKTKLITLTAKPEQSLFLQLEEEVIRLNNEKAVSPPPSDQTNKETTKNTSEIFTAVEEMPQYPGGMPELITFLSKNLKYPEAAAKAGVQGNVFVSFIVSETGSVQEVTILKGIGSGCDEEALRVVKMMPNWKPGRQSGIPVNVKYTLPVRFSTETLPVAKELPSNLIDGKDVPLYIVDGKEVSPDFIKTINQKSIMTINVLKGNIATEKYGEKGKKGVVEIILKKN